MSLKLVGEQSKNGVVAVDHGGGRAEQTDVATS